VIHLAYAVQGNSWLFNRFGFVLRRVVPILREIDSRNQHSGNVRRHEILIGNSPLPRPGGQYVGMRLTIFAYIRLSGLNICVPRKKSLPTLFKEHEGVRRNHATELAEDYVEAIADLIERDGQCRLTEIAKHFAVSHVTANRTVARLKKSGLATSKPHGPIELTLAGFKLAEKSKRRHAIVLAFLVALGISPAIARMDAEGIEHHVSDETLQHMQAYSKWKSTKPRSPKP